MRHKHYNHRRLWQPGLSSTSKKQRLSVICYLFCENTAFSNNDNLFKISTFDDTLSSKALKLSSCKAFSLYNRASIAF